MLDWTASVEIPDCSRSCIIELEAVRAIAEVRVVDEGQIEVMKDQ